MASMPICSIDGCDKRVFSRGWCSKHWKRWRTTGDPLTTKKTPSGDATRFFREVVVPYAGDDCLTWPFKRGKNGYGHLGVDRRMQLVHRLACEAVNGPPPTPEHQAAHTCGKGRDGCCNPKHLRWATAKENTADKNAHGTMLRGSDNGWAKLTEADVRQVRALRGKLSQRKLAAMFGVSQAHVWRLHHEVSWDHLSAVA